MELYGYYDVVVVGGGTSGVAAAISSARTGAKTILIERFGAIGGQLNVSGPPGWAYAHLWNARGEQCLGGFIEETHHRLAKDGHAIPFPPPGQADDNTYCFVDPEWWGLMIYQMMTENNVNLLLHSLAVEPIKEGDAIRGVIVENTSGRMAVMGKIIIDCSGEGDLASRAGAPFEKVTKEQYELEPPSITFTMDGVEWDEVIAYIKANYQDWATTRQKSFETEAEFKARAKKHVERLKNLKTVNDLVAMGTFSFAKLTEEAIKNGDYHEFGDLGFFFTPREGGVVQAIYQHSSQVYQCDATDVRDLTAGEVEARRQVAIAVKAAQKYIPGFKHSYLSRITSYLRIRETRRIMGDYKLMHDDSYEARKFPDVIGKSVMGMGAHHVANPTTIILTPGLKYGIQDGGSFDLPYRILVPQKVESLLVAGKMVSADRECYLRFLPETMVTGQAAGVAAGLCALRGITPREMEKDVTELQSVLQKQGAILFGTH